MSNNKVHQVKKDNIIRRYRVIPYNDLVPLLENDEVAFFEDSKTEPLNRSTIWKAARKLSRMVGKPVVAQRALYQIDKKPPLEGYLFSVVDQ